MFDTPKSIKQQLNEKLNNYVEAGVVIIKDNKSEFKVTIKTPSDFRDTGLFKASNDLRFDTSDYHHKTAKKVLKNMGFSFDGSGTHVLKKIVVHSPETRVVHISEIDDDKLTMISKIFLKQCMDDNGDVNIDYMLENVKGISQTLEADIQLLSSL